MEMAFAAPSNPPTTKAPTTLPTYHPSTKSCTFCGDYKDFYNFYTPIHAHMKAGKNSAGVTTCQKVKGKKTKAFCMIALRTGSNYVGIVNADNKNYFDNTEGVDRSCWLKSDGSAFCRGVDGNISESYINLVKFLPYDTVCAAVKKGKLRFSVNGKDVGVVFKIPKSKTWYGGYWSGSTGAIAQCANKKIRIQAPATPGPIATPKPTIGAAR